MSVKETITQAAATLFAEKGYSAATIKDIAAEAGVARGLLHYHFKDKEDLLIQVMQAMFEKALGPASFDVSNITNPEQLAAAATELFRKALRETPDYFALTYGILQVARRSDAVRASMEAVWARNRDYGHELIDTLKEKKIITSSLSSADLLTMLIGMLHGIAIQAIGEPGLQLAESDGIWLAVEQSLIFLFGRS